MAECEEHRGWGCLKCDYREFFTCLDNGHEKPSVADPDVLVLTATAPHTLAITGRVQLYRCPRCKQLAMIE